MWFDDAALWGLFTSATLAATLLPGGSEALLLYLASTDEYAPSTLLWVATVGNTLGGLINWGMGWLVAKRYPADHLQDKHATKAISLIQRYGVWSLLFAWVPMIGDPLCLAAGWLRLNFLACLVCIACGKAARYALLLWPMIA